MSMTKVKRLEARITEDQKERFERAATLRGQSLTDFVIGAVEEAASRAIHDHEVLALSARDARLFAEAILDPPAPSPRFLAAMREYLDTIEER